jgi:hypothetical protein
MLDTMIVIANNLLFVPSRPERSEAPGPKNLDPRSPLRFGGDDISVIATSDFIFLTMTTNKVVRPEKKNVKRGMNHSCPRVCIAVIAPVLRSASRGEGQR